MTFPIFTDSKCGGRRSDNPVPASACRMDGGLNPHYKQTEEIL